MSGPDSGFLRHLPENQAFAWDPDASMQASAEERTNRAAADFSTRHCAHTILYTIHWVDSGWMSGTILSDTFTALPSSAGACML